MSFIFFKWSRSSPIKQKGCFVLRERVASLCRASSKNLLLKRLVKWSVTACFLTVSKRFAIVIASSICLAKRFKKLNSSSFSSFLGENTDKNPLNWSLTEIGNMIIVLTLLLSVYFLRVSSSILGIFSSIKSFKLT